MNVRWFFFSLLLGVIACGAAPSDGLAQCGDCQTDIDANLHVNPQTAFWVVRAVSQSPVFGLLHLHSSVRLQRRFECGTQ